MVDIFDGLGNCRYRVQSIVSEESLLKLDQAEIHEKLQYDFAHSLAQNLIDSDKLVLKKDTAPTVSPQYSADLFIFNEDEFKILIHNISMRSLHELRYAQRNHFYGVGDTNGLISAAQTEGEDHAR